MMRFNMSKVRGLVHEKFKTEAAFGEAIGMSPHTTSKKLNGKSKWDQGEITEACDVLDIAYVDIPIYFFIPLVQ